MAATVPLVPDSIFVFFTREGISLLLLLMLARALLEMAFLAFFLFFFIACLGFLAAISLGREGGTDLTEDPALDLGCFLEEALEEGRDLAVETLDLADFLDPADLLWTDVVFRLFMAPMTLDASLLFGSAVGPFSPLPGLSAFSSAEAFFVPLAAAARPPPFLCFNGLSNLGWVPQTSPTMLKTFSAVRSVGLGCCLCLG